MNSIPLIKGNTPQEINTSIIALKKALSELEAQDRLLQGTDKDVQDKIKQINELIEGINTHLGTVDTHLTTIYGQIAALQPVDTVTSGNMHSVTSNAVYPIKEKADFLYDINVLYRIKNLPLIDWTSLPSQSADDTVYFKEWLDYMYNNHYIEDLTHVYIGIANPNYMCMYWGFTYGGADLYNWSVFYYMKPDTPMRKFGYRNGVWFCDLA